MDTIDARTREILNMNSYDKKLTWLSQWYNKTELMQLNEQDINDLYLFCQPKKIKISELEHVPTDSYLINSPDGFVRAHTWRNKGTKECVEISTESGRKIVSSIDHFFETGNNKWKYATYLTINDTVLTIHGPERVRSVEYVGKHTVYDFHIDHENHRYYTNGISSHNSGSGKSLVMMNLALNWLQAGLSGVYITLELSEELTSLRTDAMLTNMSTKEIRKNLDTTELTVKMVEKKAGKYRVKGMPAQSNVNQIRSYLKEVQIQTGIKIDFVMIDYLDLVMPVSVKVNPNDQFIKDKFVSEELRNLAKELGILMVTASQLNRSAVEEIEFDHSHIAGGISKINTADYVFGIFTSRSMRERGKYQIQCMKSRSSTGVGQKIDLEYNIETMRITDESDPDDEKNIKSTPLDIMKSLKPASIVDQNTGEIIPSGEKTGNFDKPTKLQMMLNSLKK